MKTYSKYLTAIFLIAISLCKAQQLIETVKDYDGNEYHAIKIGNQIWLKENIKSLHYTDGVPIPGVVAYNNDESMASIYGRLYTWDAAMRNSNKEKVQGLAPAGYHIPSDAEWLELENYLGGASVAGGKMKDPGTALWKSPNTDADNSSGLSILPAGEYDAYYSPNKFSLINEYAVFWTSTEINSSKARGRYLGYNSSASMIYDWFKVMKYSIRCIKDEGTTDADDKEYIRPTEFKLMQNFPNPFNPETVINYQLPTSSHVRLMVFDALGKEVSRLVDRELEAGNYSLIFDGRDLPSGIYFYTLNTGNQNLTRKMILIK